MNKDYQPEDRVVINSHRDLMMDRNLGKHIGDTVSIVKKNKSGLYQVRTWDGLKSYPKYNLNPVVEATPKPPLYDPSPEAQRWFQYEPDDEITRNQMREFDRFNAHKVVCDPSNNPPESIAQGKLVVDVWFRPETGLTGWYEA